VCTQSDVEEAVALEERAGGGKLPFTLGDIALALDERTVGVGSSAYS